MEPTVKPDDQSIRDLVAPWHSATAAGDVNTILGLMAEEVVFLVAGKPSNQRAQNV
jgi:ketosteroid isomerase-like protein